MTPAVACCTDNNKTETRKNDDAEPPPSPPPFLGIGLDSCIKPLAVDSSLILVQTTDFFYPLIEDPYIMGRIACANVLSDLYATGITTCDNMLMLLAPSQTFTEHERDIVISAMIRGFRDAARDAGTQVLGGQTIVNPWVLIGGVATSVCRQNDLCMPNRAVPGDVLVLTKPLGTQVAVNAYQWLRNSPADAARWESIQTAVTEEQVVCAYLRASYNMAHLNLNAAKLMRKYDAHAATDVTGFGLLGHADNLAIHQRASVQFLIHTMPILANMAAVELISGNRFGLFKGTSAETSGGLLIALPSLAAAQAYCTEFTAQDNNCSQQAWIVGDVVERQDKQQQQQAAVMVNEDGGERCRVVEVRNEFS